MFIGIDIGTQSLKVVVTDARLAPTGVARTAYQPSFPQPGWWCARSRARNRHLRPARRLRSR
jgi:sugar (pentulose or hexulose) kinase